jgi:parallel beta-helix repeat protein
VTLGGGGIAGLRKWSGGRGPQQVGTSAPARPPSWNGSEAGTIRNVPTANQAPTVNVRDHGALGDGSADDTQALAAAATAVGKAGGGVLLFPEGLYLCDGLVLAPSTVLQGAGATLRGRGGDANVLTAAEECVVQSLLVDGNGGEKASGHGIFVPPGAHHVQIRDATVENCASDGINFEEADDYAVLNTTIRKTRGEAVTVQWSNRGEIRDCHIAGAKSGIMWWGGDAAVDTAFGVQDLTIANCTVSDVVWGGIWGSCGRRITISGCRVEKCDDVGIDFEGCEDGTADGNSVSNCRVSALAVFYGCRRITFTNNTVRQGEGEGTGFHAHGTRPHKEITVTGNSLRGPREAVYTNSAMLTNSLVSGNECVSTGADVPGVYLLDSDHNEIRDNGIRVASEVGVHLVGSSDCLVTANTIETTAAPADFGRGGGVRIAHHTDRHGGRGNTISSNSILRFGTGVADDRGDDMDCRTTIVDNRVDTIWRTPGPGYTGVVERNVRLNSSEPSRYNGNRVDVAGTTRQSS